MSKKHLSRAGERASSPLPPQAGSRGGAQGCSAENPSQEEQLHSRENFSDLNWKEEGTSVPGLPDT